MIHDNYDPERDAADIKHLVIGLIMGLIACALITMCTGCTTTKYIETVREVTVAKTDTFLQKDSVFCHDSIHVKEKGDSVIIDRWHTRWKDRVVYQAVHDTITTTETKEVTKEVPAKLTWWQQTRLHIANIALWALLIAVVVWVGKQHIKKLLP
jgi:predicted RND superfamily exporter protein